MPLVRSCSKRRLIRGDSKVFVATVNGLIPGLHYSFLTAAGMQSHTAQTRRRGKIDVVSALQIEN